VRHASARYWQLRERTRSVPRAARLLDEARALILEAQTSCFLFWGDSWIPHLYERTQPAERLLDQAEAALGGASATAAVPAATTVVPPTAAPPPQSTPTFVASPAPQVEPSTAATRIAAEQPPSTPAADPPVVQEPGAPAAPSSSSSGQQRKPVSPWKGKPPKGKRRR
jgi:hypothetical protein